MQRRLIAQRDNGIYPILMQNTGRLKKTLTPSAQRILFGKAFDSASEDELRQIARVDRVHVLMLAEQGLVEREKAVRLITAINRLAAEKFAPLRQKTPERGLFLLYEDYLIETEGPGTGGILQTARSRNDLNATVLKLRLRHPYLGFLRDSMRLLAALLSKSRKHAQMVMPIYTHGQPAMPSTLGHYLLGIAKALQRDVEGIFHSADDIHSCPLGACAATGTSFPINAPRTSALLGFQAAPLHSLDAVASRDLVLRLLSALALYGTTLSRLGADLALWTTTEFDFIRFPDELTGSSSAMPQKKNPFLLEHVHGMVASLTGAFVHAAAAMHATPFTNSIAVGTEGVKPVWSAFRTATEITVLLRVMVTGAVPNPEAMMQRAVGGLTPATEFANRLVREHGLDFRTAHRIVGKAARAYVETGKGSFAELAASDCREAGVVASFADLNPASIVQRLEEGGGPASRSFENCWRHVKEQWAEQCRRIRMQKKHWEIAELNLQRETEAFLAPSRATAAFRAADVR